MSAEICAEICAEMYTPMRDARGGGVYAGGQDGSDGDRAGCEAQSEEGVKDACGGRDGSKRRRRKSHMISANISYDLGEYLA